MWLKYLVIILFFYFFALLQFSFFVHFNILGATPNFVFIFFFILIFFSSKRLYSLENLFYLICAGFFLDLFSYSHFGISFILLLIITFIFKKIFNSLRKRKNEHPIIYFIPLFAIFLIICQILSGPKESIISWTFLINIIYSSTFAVLEFFIYKIFFYKKKQMEL